MNNQQQRHRGEGSIYSRPHTRSLWIQYFKAGKPIRESTRTGNFAKAARLLRQRLAEAEANPAEQSQDRAARGRPVSRLPHQ